MYKNLYQNISQSCCLINVFLEDENISKGTGFCFLPTGEILTAAHVVTSRLPIRQDDVNDPDIKIYAKFPNIPSLEYKIDFCAITIHVEAFKVPIQLDLAVLKPVNPLTSPLKPLTACVNPPSLGEEVFLAGFSDELEPPFLIDKIIDKKYNGAREFLEAMEKGYLADMTGPLIKRAVVGNSRKIHASNSESIVECDVMYLDNNMHFGASGGPVVNSEGYAVGIITQRAMTNASQEDAPNLQVPSGAAIAISLQPLMYVMDKRAKDISLLASQ